MIYTILMALVGIVVYVVMIIKEEYDREVVVMVGALILALWLGISIIPVSLIGFHYETGRGEHVGYVTAVEKSGIIFKTGRAYVKTDVQSSQEDNYCVIDPEVFNQLEKLSKSRERITLKYFSWFSAGVKNCGGEGEIIYKIEGVN